MSWLARSLANSLRLDDDGYAENDDAPKPPDGPAFVKRNDEQDSLPSFGEEKEEGREIGDDEEEEEARGRGVKEDLTDLKETLSRQLWGVASFLAPPPAYNDRSVSNLNQLNPFDRSVSADEGEPSDSGDKSGIGQDFTEIGGRFRSGVTEISKMASNYFPFGSEENEVENGEENGRECEGLETEVCVDSGPGPLGVTDEVLAFARNIAMHPETWLDFPLDEEEDIDDFMMSDAQREHAYTIERLAPRLAALRIELCPCHMTGSYFWKVYFVLLHSRLNKQDAEILSTPQVMEARALWMQELHKQTKPESDWFGRSISYSKHSANKFDEDLVSAREFYFGRTTDMTADYETEKHLVASSETQFIDKSVIEEKPLMKSEDKDLLVGPSSKILVPNYEDDEDDWPDMEGSDFGGYKTTIPMGKEEDISFSDLEDDDCVTIPIKSKIPSMGSKTQATENLQV